MIYEYQCIECGKITERYVKKYDDIEQVRCECGAIARKVLSNVVFLNARKVAARREKDVPLD